VKGTSEGKKGREATRDEKRCERRVERANGEAKKTKNVSPMGE